MASIFRQRYTVKNADGKTICEQFKCWYIHYKNADVLERTGSHSELFE